MLNNSLRDYWFSHSNKPKPYQSQPVEEPAKAEVVESTCCESLVDTSEETTRSTKPEKFIGFKAFNKLNPTPEHIEQMHNEAAREQLGIIIDKLSGDSLVEYEAGLMAQKAQRLDWVNESFVKHDDERIYLDRIKTMALNASSGKAEMTARLAVYNSLYELHESIRNKATRGLAAAYGAKQFAQAVRQLSSIQTMVQELIRMQGKDDSKNMSVVAKIRAAKNRGDVEGLLQIIAGVLAFQLTGSTKEVQ